MSITYRSKDDCEYYRNGKIVISVDELKKFIAINLPIEIKLVTDVPDYHISNVYLDTNVEFSIEGDGINKFTENIKEVSNVSSQ